MNPATQKLLQLCRKGISHLYTLACIAFFLAAAHNHFRLVTFEIPLDYVEPGMLTITETLSAGKNPYTLEYQPMRITTYPPLYNIFVAPLSLIFGNNLVLHRAVAAFFILASAVLCFCIVLRVSKSYRDSFAVASIFYAGLLLYQTPTASPNGLGIFLFLASIYIPWRYNFSAGSLFVALILGILAFYTKQYFLASLGYIALYLFLAVSKIRGIRFGTGAFILFMASLSMVQATSPYFLADILFSQKNLFFYLPFLVRTRLMLNQWLAYCQLYFPIIAILLIHLVWKRFGPSRALPPALPSKTGHRHHNQINLIDLDAPLLHSRIHYFWYCLACSLIVAVYLGRNPSNPTYLMHMMSPFLLVITAGALVASGSTKRQWLYQLLLIVAFYVNYSALRDDFWIDEKPWQRLRQVIAEADDIYATSLVLPEVIDGVSEIYQNGHTGYFIFAEDQPEFLNVDNPENSPMQLWIKHVNRINAKIKAQAFDLIILDQWTRIPRLDEPRTPVDLQSKPYSDTLLKEYYYLSEVLALKMGVRGGTHNVQRRGGMYIVQLWRPLPESTTADNPRL